MKQTLESFTVRSADRWDYATFVVLQRYDEAKFAEGRGGYFMVAIESSYGHGFAYAWSHPGKSFCDFLCRCDEYYLCSKFCSGEQDPADWEETCVEIRRTICKRRAERRCSAAAAREAWPDSLFESETDFSNWNDGQKLLPHAYEYITTCPSPRKRDFLALYKTFWSAFREQLTAAKVAHDFEATS